MSQQKALLIRKTSLQIYDIFRFGHLITISILMWSFSSLEVNFMTIKFLVLNQVLIA